MRWHGDEPQHDEPQHDEPCDDAGDDARETTDAGHSTGNFLETPLTGLSGGGATHGTEGIVVGVELSKRWA
jgi:hypothetical protein